MKQRVASALLFAGIAVAVLIVNIFFGYSLTTLIAMVAFLCLFELYRCVEIPVRGVFFIYAEIFAVMTILGVLPGSYEHARLRLWYQVYMTVAFLLVTAINGFFSRDGLRKTLYLGCITLLIVTAFSTYAYWASLCTYRGQGIYDILGLAMLLFSLLAPFASDIAGLLAGMAFGKHKLAPHISPKKTWEGFAGSCVGAPLILILLGFACDSLCKVLSMPYRVSYLSLLITGLIGAVIGTAGDLFFSVIKRKNGIKDYGNIMPGHGGMLDRFDSVIFTAPVIFALYMVYPQILSVA